MKKPLIKIYRLSYTVFEEYTNKKSKSFEFPSNINISKEILGDHLNS